QRRRHGLEQHVGPQVSDVDDDRNAGGSPVLRGYPRDLGRGDRCHDEVWLVTLRGAPAEAAGEGNVEADPGHADMAAVAPRLQELQRVTRLDLHPRVAAVPVAFQRVSE